MKNKLFTKVITICLAAVTIIGLAGCGGEVLPEELDITVISREDGSGTRDAFTELTGVKKDDIDRTVDIAEISNSTAVVTQSVVGNVAAIGYISMGSMMEEVKALKIDGVEATAEKVKTGEYPLQRAFNIVTKGEVGELPQDFIDFIMSAEGQDIVKEEGFISVNDDAASYEPKGLEGTVTMAGSTSVAPVVEVLADRYKELNKDVTIEIQQTGSGAGIQSTIEDVCDIGMASRELEDEEAGKGLTSMPIALDGIAVIINNANSIDNLSMEQIMNIFIGKITRWEELM